MRASARKSYGEYKPIIIHNTGRTEILGQRGHLQIIEPQTQFYSGPTEIWHGQRGVTFKNRADAISYAQNIIDLRISDLIDSWEKYNERHRAAGLPERDISHLYELRDAQPK